MSKAPLSVTFPPAVTERAPVKVNASSSNAVVSRTVTLRSAVPANVTVLPKVLPALLTVISAPAALAVKVAAPTIDSAPLLVMLPVVAVASKVLEADEAPKFNPFASTITTLIPLVKTAPVKLFPASFRVTLPEAVAVVVPPIVRGPLLVMSPPALMFRLPEKFDVPISNADRSTTVTFAIPPLPLNATELPKLLLALLSVMFAPTPSAVNVAAPVTTSAPVVVISPRNAVASKDPEIVDAPRTKPFTSLIKTLLPLTIETAPTKLLLLLNVTALAAPAVTVVVPPMLITPGILTAPAATMVKFPP